ncbi:hypothetical protein FACS189459_6900 [Bacilli bacterium]|nr:hypothetical protein FACS189459_6900 [Bacilli bacterium]GHU52194.1 hypothetical protein FACS189496_1910 [Bacilli bacterium]
MLSKLKTPSVFYDAKIVGKRNKKYRNDKIAITRDCIAKEKLELKIGADVIIIINDKDNRYFNGSRANVVKLNEKDVDVKLLNSGEIIKIKPYL